MAEALFILTTIFVAYVVYVVVNDQRATAKTTMPQVKPEKQEVAAVQSQPEAAPKKDAPATRRAAAKPAATPGKAASTTRAPAQQAGKGELRNPATGEIASAHANYRFTKRWIKEALVKEGLLEKIYKNNELDAAAEAKIKEAVAKLEAMDKYRA